MTVQVQEVNGYERRREEFRRRILDAATALIREREGVDFSMRELASRADVSPATPFNHLGNKTGVLAALVTDSLYHIRASAPTDDTLDPIDRLFVRLSRVTAYYAENETLYRPIFKAIIGEMRPTKSASLELAISMLSQPLSDAQATGKIPDSLDISLLAEQIESFWLGTLVFWIGDVIDGESWQGRVEHGLSLLLTSVVAEGTRGALAERLAQAAKRLTSK